MVSAACLHARTRYLEQAEEQLGGSSDHEAVRRMCEARSAMLEAAAAFADSVALLDGKPPAERAERS